MEGNGPFDPRQSMAPAPSYYAPQQPSRRWLPIAIIAAAILVAGALVAGAVILAGDDSAPAASPETATPANAPETSADSPAAESETCDAWESARTALLAIPPLPSGWDWDTPNISTYISNRNTATTTALDLFEPQIADDPEDVAEAARTYVAERRKETQMLADGTYTQADGVAGTMAESTLNRLCGIT